MQQQRKRQGLRHGWRAVLVVGLVSAFAIACSSGGGSGSGSSGGGNSVLTVVAAPSPPFVAGFTPFSLSSTVYLEGAQSMVYEPLIMFNVLKPGVIYPWLATAYTWSNGGKTLTFTIRKGVKWNDGKPFTAADVEFTFQLIRKFAALNVNGVSFTGVSSSGDQVTLSFSSPAYGQLYNISQVLMVPQHIWSKITNPVTYTDTAPVGTGPYTLKSFSSQSFTLVKNPHYWMPGKPQIQTLRWVQYASNTSADLALQQGAIDWSSIFLPHYQKLFIDQDPQHNHVYLPAIGAEYVCVNDAQYPFNMPAVRKALSYAFDRDKMSTAVEQGFAVPMTSATGLLPGWSKFIAPQYQSMNVSYDPAKAKQMLLAAGFKMGSGGKMMMPNGKPFSVVFTGPTPYTDFMADMQLMSTSLNGIGVQSSVNGVGLSAWTTAYTDGTYQATMCGTFQTPGPYQLYNLELNGSLTAPVGKAAVGNYERWNDKTTNSALDSYADTQSASVQQSDLNQVEKIMVNEMPLIPLFGLTSYAEYRTAHATGFVTADNQYQMPNPSSPWDETVVLHLKPAG